MIWDSYLTTQGVFVMKCKSLSASNFCSMLAISLITLVGCGDDKQPKPEATTSKTSQGNSTKSEPTTTDTISQSNIPADAPTYTIAVESSYPPFVLQDEHGLSSGFDIDLIKAIGEHSKFHVNVKVIPWADAFPSLQGGKYDILGSGVGITEERQAIAQFSTPYLESYVAFATTNPKINSTKDMVDKIIGLQSNTAYYKTVQDNFGKTNTIKDYETFFLSCQAMLAGKADACIGDVTYLKYFKNSLKTDDNVPPIKIFEAVGTDKKLVAFAIQKDNAELLALVNDGLKKVREDGTYNKIHKKWFGD